MNLTEPLTLEGQIVRLEPLTMEHLSVLLELASLEDYPFTSVPHSEHGMRRYIQTALEEQAQGKTVPFVTVDKRSEKIVGSTRLAHLEFWNWPEGSPLARPGQPDAVEIGWTWLAPFAQRSGINTEAKLLMLTHAFEVWQVRRVTLKTDERNMRSRNAILRLGAKFEGVLRAHMPASDGGIRNSAMFSILAEEWPAVKANLQAKLAI
ncbi:MULTISPECIES: GNAT family N-acetyltransferase [unclassified Meiothermus]|uniref:GNAT family N-acetyltransferase n=1 Tax=unclassified Meiothermus TaxID=370471 RepID=UPI000D7D0DC3|nr:MULTISPECIES: GNAT family protein [unclassified Meiothermus]PZA08702.1 GNAT family N-acetyltransferase [Meiothermus sp. Pnk-1]RYM40679.1 N-acetyltransferase [Meiothermus sp. PNK-Is4]